MTHYTMAAAELARLRAQMAEPLPVQPDVAAATGHATAMLAALGLTDGSEDTAETPARFVKALAEMTSGLTVDPARHLARTFPAKSDNPGMILVPDIRFTSVCEHHLLPFVGTACVGYLPAPGARIVGLSKLARVVQEYAARPQVQERLGEQVVDAITGTLDTVGAGCVIRSEHSCMTLRGAKAEGAFMVTSHLAGAFRDDATMRGEFLTLARR